MKPTPIRPISVPRGPDYTVAAIVVASLLSLSFLLNAKLDREFQRELITLQLSLMMSAGPSSSGSGI